MILFVCTGNTCRSPLAAALAKRWGADADSAGLMAAEGRPASPGAIRAAARHGADLSGHWSQPVSDALMDGADAVYAMTQAHAEALARRFPHAAGKIHVLSPQIPDPFGGGDAEYEQCAQALLKALAGCGVIPR